MASVCLRLPWWGRPCPAVKKCGVTMHYSSGLGYLAALGTAAQLPGDGPLARTARLLLCAAGALFGLYLLVAAMTGVAGAFLRRSTPWPLDPAVPSAVSTSAGVQLPARRGRVGGRR